MFSGEKILGKLSLEVIVLNTLFTICVITDKRFSIVLQEYERAPWHKIYISVKKNRLEIEQGHGRGYFMDCDWPQTRRYKKNVMSFKIMI